MRMAIACQLTFGELCWAAVLLVVYDVRAPPSSVIKRRNSEVPGAGSLEARRRGYLTRSNSQEFIVWKRLRPAKTRAGGARRDI